MNARAGAWVSSPCPIGASLWGRTAPPLPGLEPLAGDITTDVAVIGGGFTGLSTALHLAEAGTRATVIEAQEPGWGASGRNGGQVIPGLKILPDEMARRFGRETGERIAEAAGGAPALVFDLIDRYGIDCDLRRTGWIQLAKGPEGRRTTDAHVAEWGARGAPVRALDTDEIEARVGTGAYVSGLLDDRGGNLHPLKYARGLARTCLSRGVAIHPETPALSVVRADRHWEVTTERGTVRADAVVVCTNGYTGDMLPGLSQSILPVLTGVMATRPLSDNLGARILPGRQAVADTRRLLSWFGRDSADRLVFGSRVNSQTEVIGRDNFGFGIRRLREIFPDIDLDGIEYMWTGRVALTLDHVPHIHRLADGLYAGLGYNGRGVAMATLFGKVLAAHCLGREKDADFLPVTPMPRIPFSRFRSQGLAVALTWKRLLDAARP